MSVSNFVNKKNLVRLTFICLIISQQAFGQNIDSLKGIMFNTSFHNIPDQYELKYYGKPQIPGNKLSYFSYTINFFDENSTRTSYLLNRYSREDLYGCKNLSHLSISSKVNKKILDVFSLDSFPELRELKLGVPIQHDQFVQIIKSHKHLHGLKIDLVSDSIPSCLCELSDLTWIELSTYNNTPLKWPSCTKQMNQLKFIELHQIFGNKTDVSLWQIPSLEYLKIFADLSSIPNDIQVRNLRVLILYSGGDLSLPKTVSTLESLLSLEIHTEGQLNISDHLQSMRQLRSLHISTDILSRSPNFKGLSRLKYLYVHAKNQNPVRLDVNGLDSIESVTLSGTNFEAQLDFPLGLEKAFQLKELIIDKCSIMNIPEYFSELKKLESLYLSEYNQLDFDDFKFLAEKTGVRNVHTIRNGHLSMAQKESEILKKYRFQDASRYPKYRPFFESSYESYYINRMKTLKTY